MAGGPCGRLGFAGRVGIAGRPRHRPAPAASPSAGAPASNRRGRPAIGHASGPRRHERHDASRAGRPPPGPAAPRGRRPDRLAHHDRSQADRHPLHHLGIRDVPRRRPAGGRDADRARRARPPADDRRGLRPAVHDARHDHAAAVRDADGRRPGELHRPAPDRRRGHGLPARERPVVLDVPVRGARRPERLPGPRRTGRGRVDRLRPAQRPDLGARRRRSTCGSSGWRSSASRACSAPSTSSSRSTRCGRPGCACSGCRSSPGTSS